MLRIRFLVAALALALVLPILGQAQGQERYRAFAVNMSNIGTGGSTTVDIVIDRWSTDSEKARLFEALQKSPDALLTALQGVRPRVGFIQVPGRTSWDLRYASKVKGEDGGWRIVVATDRPIGFREATNRPRTIDYPFTLIEMHLNGDGQGEGKASIFTKITWEEATRTLELENYASEPVRLQTIQKVK